MSEEVMETFEGWMESQALHPSTSAELEEYRTMYNEAKARAQATPKAGRMKLKPIAGGTRYAVAIRDGTNLWLALWMRRAPKPEFFVMVPRGKGAWNPHASYHNDGQLHHKGHDCKMFETKHQPFTGEFKGTVHVGMFAFSVQGTKAVGAVCDPEDFDEVIEIDPGLVQGKGYIAVDLVEPGREPITLKPAVVLKEETIKEVTPWVVVRVGTNR